MYTLKTNGNQSGPEMYIQRGRKDGNGRYFTSREEDAVAYEGFIAAKKRAEEAALHHHIAIDILEDGLRVATISTNLTMTEHVPQESTKSLQSHRNGCGCDDCLVSKLTAFKDMGALLNAKGHYRPSLTKQNADTRRLADLYDAYQESRGDNRRAFRG